MRTQTTAFASQMLSVFDTIRINNDEKITNDDRQFCEDQQQLLYQSLQQIDKWYNIYREETLLYLESHKVEFKPNGSVSFREPYYKSPIDYSEFEFRPFSAINEMVTKRLRAINRFARTILSYFNDKYGVSVPFAEIDEANTPLNFQPLYTTYVDIVIGHLGGRCFRETAEDEVLMRFKSVVTKNWSDKSPELKNKKITFYDIYRFDGYYFQYQQNKISYNYTKEIELFCEGIALFCDDRLGGNSKIISQFNSDNVDISEAYNLNTTTDITMKFYKNGRIDVCFQDQETAQRCFYRMKLNETHPKN